MTQRAPVGVQDVHDIAGALPGVEFGTSWGDRPTYKVRGRGFVIWRGAQKDAVDPDTGERMTDVIRISVPTMADRQALLQGDGPWFTTPHFDGDASVLVRERDLHLLDRDELREVITEAWARYAPARVVAEHLG